VDFKAEEGLMERGEDPRPGDGRDEVRGLGDAEPRYVPARVERAPDPAGVRRGPAWDDDDAEGDDRTERARRDPSKVRAEDTEPYVGLQYVARLFKVVAMVVIVALTAEIVAALVMEGPDALLPLFLELLQGAVLAAVLWGASDLTLLFIDVGHDVRAQRVLLGRMSARLGGGFDAAETPPQQVRRAPRGGDGYAG
jgi:hypothetical protein